MTLTVWLMAACALTGVVGIIGWLRPASSRLRTVGEAGGLACLLLSLVVWLMRWSEAGHLPLFGTYESSLSLALAVLLGALILWFKSRGTGLAWPVACLVAAGLVAHGSFFDRTVYALTISERSWVVDVHSLLAWAAFGALAANASLAAYRLISRRDSKKVDRWLVLSLEIGFVAHSAMLASGSVYKFLLFGTAWSFDPIEILGMLAWLSYGTLLHMHAFAGWNGRRLAIWCLALFVLLTVTYRGIVYFPSWSSYHILDMDLRMHVAPPQQPGETP
jgi:ABC-type transport system involved in cytochrome c biogenesis permease subunit